MKQSDRTILMFMPAAIVVLGYAAVVNPRSQSQYRRVGKQYEAAREKSVSDQQLLTAKNRLLAEKKQQENLKKRVQVAASRIGQLQRQLGKPTSQLRAVRDIEAIAVESSIAVVKQEVVSRPSLPRLLSEVLKPAKPGGSPPDRRLQYRRYQLRGRYSNMVKFMRALAARAKHAVPLMLEMAASKSGEGEHTWELMVAM